MRPMLAINASENLSSLPYPLLSSEKIDGIRCVVKDGVAVSRTLKPIRNRYIQSILANPELEGVDGELVVGAPNSSTCMRDTNSGVMSYDGEPDFTFYVFDFWKRPGVQYHKALAHLESLTNVLAIPQIKLHTQRTLHTPRELEAHEYEALDAGFEGLIVRRPDGAYKFGRSTKREGYLLKIKRYHQDEARIIGYKPWMHNANDPVVNELGYTSRPKNQDGLIELPMLGAFVVEGWSPVLPDTRVQFDVGSGFTHEERHRLWACREDCIGQHLTYKFFPKGCKDKPRHPIFISFRNPEDM